MDGSQLLLRALEGLKAHWATRSIVERSNTESFDRELAVRICTLLFAKCNDALTEFDRAISDFIDFSAEFVRLQMELEQTGHYRYQNYDEARVAVYDNPAVMNSRYLNGLFLSIAFWTNHTRIFQYYVANFCNSLPPSGSALEVPSGTGIYISEFARRNRGWKSIGIDISDSAVVYGNAIALLNDAMEATIVNADVFALAEDRLYNRIVCGELLEHLEHPEELLKKLAGLLAREGKLFLTTAIWAASLDHIYLFRSTQEARQMIGAYFTIESELALSILDGKGPEEERTPVNYACILTARR